MRVGKQTREGIKDRDVLRGPSRTSKKVGSGS